MAPSHANSRPVQAGPSQRAVAPSTVSLGVSAEFCVTFCDEVLAAFGMNQDNLKWPESNDEWTARLCACVGENDGEDDSASTSNTESVEVCAPWGLRASKRAVAHSKYLVRVPRCRDTGDDGKAWDLVEAEIRRPLPEGIITTTTKIGVRPKARALRHGDACTRAGCEMCRNDEKASELWRQFGAAQNIQDHKTADAAKTAAETASQVGHRVKFVELEARDVVVIKTSDVVDLVIKPVTMWSGAGDLIPKEKRKTLIEHVCAVHSDRAYADRYLCGPANVFVSHAWKDSFLDMTDAVARNESKASLVIMITYETLVKPFMTWEAVHSRINSIEGGRPLSFVTLLKLAMYLMFLAAVYFITFSTLLPLCAYLFVPRSTLVKFRNRMRRRTPKHDSWWCWLDIACKNQWVVEGDDTARELEQAVGAMQALWFVCHHWTDPLALTRSWCQYELRAANVTGVQLVGRVCDREGNEISRHIGNYILNAPWWFIRLLFFDCSSEISNRLIHDAAHDVLVNGISKADARRAEAQFKKDRDHILDLIKQGRLGLGMYGQHHVSTQSISEEVAKSNIEQHNLKIKEMYLKCLNRMAMIQNFSRMYLFVGSSFVYVFTFLWTFWFGYNVTVFLFYVLGMVICYVQEVLLIDINVHTLLRRILINQASSLQYDVHDKLDKDESRLRFMWMAFKAFTWMLVLILLYLIGSFLLRRYSVL